MATGFVDGWLAKRGVPAPSPLLTSWMAAQADADLFISAMTVAELRRGILRLPAGKRRRGLEDWFAGASGPLALFVGRILAFDVRAGLVWARLMAERSRSGRPRSPLDMIVASIAEANDCIVVTDKVRDFDGIPIINPLRAGA